MLDISNVFFLLIGILTLAYFWIKHTYSYWKRHNVVHIKPVPVFGNFMPTLTLQQSFSENMKDLYDDPSVQNEPIVGLHLLNEPILLLRNLDIIKNVLIKDFHHFENRFETCDPKDDPLGYFNILFVKSPEWRTIRQKLSPVFTSGKLKQMYPLMVEIAHQLEQHLEQQTSLNGEGSVIKELKELAALFTTDVIASVAFGIQAHSIDNPNGDFRRNGRKMLNFTIMRALESFIILFKPSLVPIFKPKVFGKEFSQFLSSSIQHVMDERERSGVQRNDLIDILVALKKENAADKSTSSFKMTQDFLVAQAAVFLSAGFETSSAVVSFSLYELAKRQDLQQILRNEIHQELLTGGGHITYEKLQSMEYLDMVVAETLRKYPPVSFLNRQLTLSDVKGSYSLQPHHDFAMPNNMPAYISVFAIHRDPQYWPDPNTFDPERFSAANKRSHKAYLPFGLGPRNCIGMRMGLLQAKLGIVHILRNHVVRTCERTPQEIRFDKKSFLLASADGIYLNIVKDSMSKDS